ncbi:hypothetical protein SRHO_G00095820 [Serrasalmus rhombeus]
MNVLSVTESAKAASPVVNVSSPFLEDDDNIPERKNPPQVKKDEVPALWFWKAMVVRASSVEIKAAVLQLLWEDLFHLCAESTSACPRASCTSGCSSRLVYPVHITHITLENLPKGLSPNGHSYSTPKSSAPKEWAGLTRRELS